MSDDPKWKLWLKDRNWDRWIAVIAILVAIVFGYDARKNKDEIVQSQQQTADAIAAKITAEQRATAAESSASQLKSENAKLQSSSIDHLLSLYDDHLNAIARAASEYDRVSRLPNNSDNIPKKAAAERDLYNAVASFSQFVGKWRDFAQTLGKILDGNVQKMDDARNRHSPSDIKDALDILRRSFPDLRLEVQLGQIASG